MYLQITAERKRIECLKKIENMIFERTWKKAQKKARKKTMPFLVSAKVDIEKWLKAYQGGHKPS